MWIFLMDNLPVVICFILGIGLLITEVFMPGFGLAGISGIVLEGAAIVMVYLWYGGIPALALTLAILVIVGVAIALALRSAKKGRLSKSPIILSESETTEKGYTATSDMESFVGREGVTLTVLRPVGMADFDGVKVNVVADGEYIPKNIPVMVDRVEGVSVVVRRLRSSQETSES